MAEQSITIKFDGQAHQVDLVTFSQVLMNYSAVIQACAKETGLDDPVSLYVNATEPGSLDVVLSVIAEQAGGLLSFLNDNAGAVEGLGTAIATATGLYTLKKKLSGKGKVEDIKDNGDGTSMVITQNENVVVNNTVVKVFANQPGASDAINDTFRALEDNTAIEGFEMISNGETTFRAERAEFSGIANSSSYENASVRHVSKEGIVSVVKPYLDTGGNRSWRVVFEGTEITATITDENFLNNLRKYSFTVGTTMEVAFDITQEFVPSLDTYLNKKYVITEVMNVNTPPTTNPMF